MKALLTTHRKMLVHITQSIVLMLGLVVTLDITPETVGEQVDVIITSLIVLVGGGIGIERVANKNA